MRRKFLFSSGVLVTLASVVCAQVGQEETPDYGNLVREARRTASGVLEGRSLAVRIYPDLKNAPDRSVLVRVPIHDLAVRFSAIKAAYPSITESAYVLIQAADQTDPDLAAVLAGYVCMQPYTPQRTQTIWFLNSRTPYAATWTFLDALGGPMAGAKVQVDVRPDPGSDVAGIRVGGGTLDERGQLPRLLPRNAELTLTVEHSNYGIAAVQLGSRSGSEAGIIVVPLLPKDSQAFSSAIQGTVVDSQGHPIAGVPVSLRMLGPTDPNDYYRRRFQSQAITNEQGWFALCQPWLSEDFTLGELPAPGTRQEISILPDRSLNLRQSRQTVSTGVARILTLTAMSGEEFFHTFSFEYYDGSTPNREELEATELGLWRDRTEWLTLSYDEFKDGYYLPTGTLQAGTIHQGTRVAFVSIELTADSPEHLAFTTGPLIVFRGRVVEGSTGTPMGGVYILGNWSDSLADPCTLTAEQWERFAAQASQEAASDAVFYRESDRVTLTDADGVFEMAFVPTEARFFGFSLDALALGYPAGRSEPVTWRAGKGTVIEVPTMTLSRKGAAYFPQFIFEDESAPVTDADKLGEIALTIRNGNRASMRVLDRFLGRRQFIPGVYAAEATWGEQHYTFEPVDLTVARPEVVVFRPLRIRPTQITYQGVVVNGITRAPVPRALVTFVNHGSTFDSSSLKPEQWAAIRALDRVPDPTDPALAPVLALTSYGTISSLEAFALTDDAGAFRLTVEQKTDAFRASLAVLVENCMSLPVQLEKSGSSTISDPTGSAFRYEPDEAGVATVPVLSVYPAGIVALCPVLSDPGGDRAPQFRTDLRWSAAPGESPAWLTDMAHAAYRYVRPPNVPNTVYVPAGVTLDLALRLSPSAGMAMVPLGRVRLAQGETVDFGRVEFKPGVAMVVKVIDASGAPVAGVTVSCTGADASLVLASGRTAEDGKVTLHVPARSAGIVTARATDSLLGTYADGSVPYQVGDAEDAGQELLVVLTASQM